MNRTTASALSSRRRRALRATAAQAKVQALLVTREEDVRYLSGFTGDDSFLLLGPSWAVLLTDGRYTEQAGQECPGVTVYTRKESLPKAVAKFAKEHKVRRMGVQAEGVVLLLQDQLLAELKNCRMAPVKGVVAGLRVVKDAAEVAAVRKAVGVAERAFLALIRRGAKRLIGRSEREIAAELDYLMRLEGADGPAFDTIVAAGAHASRPHHRSGPTKVRRGQAVLIDWGAKVDGYCSDLTRVVFVGRIAPKLAAIYDVVLRAQAAGIGSLRSGVSCKSADAAARAVTAKAGYADKFVHGLGHGIGLEVHEAPALGGATAGRLRQGMVVTVEPGIYLPGIGGIRIEDDVLVTRRGRRKLSALPASPEAMTLG